MRNPTFLLSGLVLLILACVCATAAAIEPVGPFRGKFSEGFETQQDSFATELPVFGGESTVRNLFEGPYLHLSGYWVGIGVVSARSGISFMGSVGGGVEWIFDLPAGRFGGYFTVLNLLPNTEGAVAYFYDVNDDLLAQMDVNAPYSTWIWNGWVSDVPIKRIEIIGLGSSGWLDLGGFVMHDDMEYTPFGEPGTIHYVDDDSTGANDGSSWEDAFVCLQDALAAAHYGDEILVAQGIYKPDMGAGVTDGDREATFQLKNGVTIKGGYGGAGTSDPDVRDVELYETVLSGDLNGDDEPNFVNYSENSYHVVNGSDTDSSATLEGLTVTGGNAETYPYEDGGGIYNYCGSPTLNKCTLIANFAGRYGGAMYTEQGSPTLDNCMFYDNSVIGFRDGSGGGMYNISGNPILTNCTFERNCVYVYECEIENSGGGGGMSNVGGRPELINCAFNYNSAMHSGGVFNDHSYSSLTNCTFTGNTSDYSAGGMSNHYCNAAITNCTFKRNSNAVVNIDTDGLSLSNCTFIGNSVGIVNYGGITSLENCIFRENFIGIINDYEYRSSSTLANCMFIGNSLGIESYGVNTRLTNCIFSGNRGATFFDYSDIQYILMHCTFSGNEGVIGVDGEAIATFTNCISWGNKRLQFDDDGELVINHSCIEGSTGTLVGVGNIDSDPCFVDPGYWDANGTPDDANDDFWVNGDYRLKASSPCIDAAGDTGASYDIEGNVRPVDFPCVDNNGELRDFDMGAYEAVATTEGKLTVLPRTVNRSSQDETVLALIRLPDLIVKDDVDSDELVVLFPGTVSAIEQYYVPAGKAAQGSVRILSVFDKAELLAVTEDDGEVELTIIGRLVSGAYFYCTDKIRIIGSRD